LVIAKEIIERLGGSLTIENRKPSGLKQTVMLAAQSGGAFGCPSRGLARRGGNLIGDRDMMVSS
jgi:hypothetical protein